MRIVKSKLFETILTLSKEERNEIPEFIASPIFYTDFQRDKIQRLYKILRGEVERYENGKLELLSDKEILSQLYSGTVITTLLDPFASRLLRIIKKAIAFWYSGIGNTPQYKDDSLPADTEIAHLWAHLLFHRQRKTRTLFDLTYQRLKALDEQTPLSIESFYRLYAAEREAFLFESTYNAKQSAEQRARIVERLDAFYIIAKLEILNQEPHTLHQTLLPLESIGQSVTDQTVRPLLAIFRALEQLLAFKSEEHFDFFVQLLVQHEAILYDDLKKDLYANARNFCIAMYKKGHLPFLKRAFDLFKKNLNDGLLYREDANKRRGLLHSTFLSMVTNALKLNEIDWAIAFIEDHRERVIALNESDVDRFCFYNLAQCYLASHDFDAALSVLDVEFTYLTYQLAARCLEIKLYFEKSYRKDSEFDFLLDRLSAFSTFLARRSDISVVERKGYRNFIRFVRNLLDKNAKRESKRQAIYANICNEANVAAREWLIEKALENIASANTAKALMPEKT